MMKNIFKKEVKIFYNIRIYKTTNKKDICIKNFIYCWLLQVSINFLLINLLLYLSKEYL